MRKLGATVDLVKQTTLNTWSDRSSTSFELQGHTGLILAIMRL